jgi:hypothetical protein
MHLYTHGFLSASAASWEISDGAFNPYQPLSARSDVIWFVFMRSCFTKDTGTTAEFRRICAPLKTQPDQPNVIGECLGLFLTAFYDLQSDEFSRLPLKKELGWFSHGLMIWIVSSLGSRRDIFSALMVLIKCSCFFPPMPEVAGPAVELLAAICGRSAEGFVKTSAAFFDHVISNRFVVLELTKENTLSMLWNIGLAREPKIQNYLFSLLSRAIHKKGARVSQYLSFSELAVNSLRVAPLSAVHFLADLYRITGENPVLEGAFGHFNEAAVRLKSACFYAHLFHVKTRLPQLQCRAFENLCRSTSPELSFELFQLLFKHSDLPIALIPFFSRIKDIDLRIQAAFFELVWRQRPRCRMELLAQCFPPWVYQIDCFYLKYFLENHFEGHSSLTFLIKTLSADALVLKTAFDSIPAFSELIVTLFSAIDDFVPLPSLFEKLVPVISLKSKRAADCFELLCGLFPAAISKDVHLSHMADLRKSPYFTSRLPWIIRNVPMLSHELLTDKFVDFCVSSGQFNTLATLAADGPYPVIDGACVRQIGAFAKLSNAQIERLSSGRMIDDSDTCSDFTTIRVPALCPLLSTIRLPTLFDRSVVAQYMIDNGFVKIDDPWFNELGVQYLTLSLAVAVIDHPSVLRRITLPVFPHEDAYQFQHGHLNATAYVSLPASFGFCFDRLEGTSVLIELEPGNAIIVDSARLVYRDSSYPIEARVWYTIEITASLHILLNGKDLFGLRTSENVTHFTLGAVSGPGSTFYIRGIGDALLQLGPGTLFVKYRGFLHFAPLIDAIPQILERMLRTEDVAEFTDYVGALLNLRCLTRGLRFLGIIRVILHEKPSLVTPEIINELLAACFEDGSLRWTNFEGVFMDYEFWARCKTLLQELLDWRSRGILHSIDEADGELASQSLFHFFVDFCNTDDSECRLLDELIVTHFRPTHASLLAFLDRNPSKFIDRILRQFPVILDAVPLSLAAQLSPQLLLLYLERYALRCIDDDGLFDDQGLWSLVSSLCSLRSEQSLWLSIFMLLTRTRQARLNGFLGATVVRPSVLRLVFTLLCDNTTMSSVVAVLLGIEFDLSEHAREFQLLVRRTKVSEPLFAPGSSPGADFDFSPFVDEMCLFGFVSTSYCSSALFSDIPPTDDVVEASEPSPNLFKLLMQLLVSSLRPSWTDSVFASFFSFGSDLEQQTAVRLHQECVHEFLAATAAPKSFLAYLGDAVKFRWWELQSPALFAAVCRSVQATALGPEHANFFKIFFSVHPVDFSDFVDVILNDSLCTIPDYLPFIYSAVSMSDLPDKQLLLRAISEKTAHAASVALSGGAVLSQSESLSSLHAKYTQIRGALMRPPAGTSAYVQKCLRRLYRFLFEVRYDILSIRNEQWAYTLWMHLPPPLPTHFQVPPSVHPVSVPTVFVPFISRISDSNFASYAAFARRVHTNGAQFAEVPPCTRAFVSQPFFPLPPEWAKPLFECVYGKIDSVEPVSIGSSTELIQCALVRSGCRFFLVVNANANLTLEPPSEHLTIAVMFDAFCAGYYGPSSLFWGRPVLHFRASDVTISAAREYCHSSTALEVWFASGYSLFLIFGSSEARAEYERVLCTHCILPPSKSIFSLAFGSKLTRLAREGSNLKAFRMKWVSNHLSSFAYLLILNFFADRSFANMSQYPVMPWVQPGRDFARPMGQQTPERGAMFIDKYRESGPDYHFYGSLYSSPAITYHFLMRVEPFTIYHIDLQNGFDRAERLFYSIKSDWEVAHSTSRHGVHELIPELFVLPELFVNTNGWKIPLKTNGNSIAECLLPDGTPNWPAFVWAHRRQLDDAPDLEKWLDLVFGASSRGQPALDALNVFYPSTYGLPCSMFPEESEAFRAMKRNYGQVPTQLFLEPHPPRNTVIHSRSSQLISTDSITCQHIKTFVNESGKMVVSKNGTFGAQNPLQLFRELSKMNSVGYSKSIVRWKEIRVDTFRASAFSNDHFLFAAGLECGALIVFRALTKADGAIAGYAPAAFACPPTELITEAPVLSCAVSSHLFVACVGVGSTVFTYHVNSARFIRSIPFSGPVCQLLINDTYQVIFGIGTSFIEVFTINGTRVAFTDAPGDNVTASALSVNDVSVFLATGHESGKVVLWEIDPAAQQMIPRKTLTTDTAVVAVDVLQHGSALVAVTAGWEATVFCARGNHKSLFKAGSALGCAGCGSNGNLTDCGSCGLYFCVKCCEKTSRSKSLCRQCLAQIAEYATILDAKS